MKHVKQLDGLRCIAILFVLISHFAYTVGQYFSAGYFGVDLFFVLSGFLITGILLKPSKSFWNAYGTFIGRRILRIFPVYYLTILILFIVNYDYVHHYLLYCLTYTYNYAWVYFRIPENAISHFWSLCVEEQFYLFAPFIIIGLRNKLQIVYIFLILLIVVSGSQLYSNIFPVFSAYNGVGIFPQVYSLSVGALGAVINSEQKLPLKLLRNKWVEYAALLFLVFLLATHYNIKYIFCPFLSLFIVLKAVMGSFATRGLNNLLKHNGIRYIGVISYGIYLFHPPLAFYLTKFIFSKISMKLIVNKYFWLLKLPVYSSLSIIIAHYSYKYFEKWFLNLKDRYFRYK